MKLFKTSDTKQLDNYTIQHEPISAIDLMERAATTLLYEVMALWRISVPVVLFAGAGNNGGDALALARLLFQEGYSIKVYLFNPKEQLSPECARNKQRLLEISDIDFTEVINEFIPPKLEEHMLVIDGLFGAGLRSPLMGGYASLVDYINLSPAQVLAIDTPSGLLGEDNSRNNYRHIIQADYTFALHAPKLSFFLPENEFYVGAWRVLDIGLSPQIEESFDTPYHYTTPADAAALLKTRSRFVSKRNLGHALLFAGSRGMMGAAMLASQAAMRSGVGLLTVHAPACGYALLQGAIPEALAECDREANHIVNMMPQHRYNAIGVGPGIGRNEATAEALHALLGQHKQPLVLDADALNLLATHADWLSLLPANSLLTPHVAEFERLFGESRCGYDRTMLASRAAMQYRVIIILKGAYTVVALPDGSIHFNTTGNAGMATAGSGDVLTGVLLSLLAQGYAPDQAARLGVLLHGLAGDLALQSESQESLLASDIVNHLGKAFRSLQSLSL